MPTQSRLVRRSLALALVAGLALVAPRPAGATTTLTQSAPFSGSAVATHTFSDQLMVAGASGTLTFSMVTTPPSGVSVSSSGLVTSDGTTPVGSYNVSGTVTDTAGDTGNWSYALTITGDGATITQTSPTSGSAAALTTFSYQLITSGQVGVESVYATSALPAGVAVSTSGLVTGNGTTPMGTYTLIGTTSDTFGGSGVWGYTLNVTSDGVTLTQTSPTTLTEAASQPFSTSLAVSGATGPVTFTATSTLPAGITVSSSGLLASDGTTPAGTYTITGTDSDSFGGSGTWTITLTLSPTGATITQSAPTSATLAAGSPASVQLATTDTNAVTFTATSTLPAGITVSSSGLLASDGTTPAGTYTITGTDSDSFGGSGTWTITLTLSPSLGPIVQVAPTVLDATVGTPASLALATSDVHPVTFTTTGRLPAGVTVSASGVVASDGITPAGVYNLSGALSDPVGDSGVWNAELIVAPATTSLTQLAPLAGTTTAGSAFSAQLTTTPGASVFALTSSAPSGVTVSSSGLVSASATTPAGTYYLSGTVTAGTVTGVWDYTLVVAAHLGVLSLVSPTSATTTAGPAFSTQLVASAPGCVFTLAGSPAGVALSSTGLLTESGAPAGVLSVVGTLTDPAGDVGTFTFTLVVLARSGALSVTPNSVSLAPGASTHLVVAGASGTVRVVATDDAGLVVTPDGTVSVPIATAPGVYTLTGYVTDPAGDVGSWSLTLTVAAPTSATLTLLNPLSQASAPGSWAPLTGSLAVTLTTSTPRVCTVSGPFVLFVAGGACVVSVAAPGENPLTVRVVVSGRAPRPVVVRLALPRVGANPARLGPSVTRTLGAVASRLAGQWVHELRVEWSGPATSADLARARTLTTFLAARLRSLGDPVRPTLVRVAGSGAVTIIGR